MAAVDPLFDQTALLVVDPLAGADPLVVVDLLFHRAARQAVDPPDLAGPVAAAGRTALFSPVPEPKRSPASRGTEQPPLATFASEAFAG
jgi:hypothetical protein